MKQIALRFSLFIVFWLAWLRTTAAAGLRHGASREQLVQQEIATEEFFEARVDEQAPNDGDPGMASGLQLEKKAALTEEGALTDNLRNWPAIAAETGSTTSNDVKYKRPEWQSAVDRKSGRTFYFDRVTNRTQWSPPDFHEASVFKANSRSSTEAVDLTCLRHTGTRCTVTKFGSDLLHSCVQLTGGASNCVGGGGGGECLCDEGYCGSSKGHCLPERSTYVPGTFVISTKGTKNEYLKMVVDQAGTGYVTLSSDPNDSACQWRIVKRPDASHILTTVKYPVAGADFFNVCQGEDCMMHVGASLNPVGSEIGTQLKFVQHHLVISDTHSQTVLFFPRNKDGSSAKTAQGCSLKGYDCPTDSGFLVFTPELPSEFLDNLEDVDYEYWKTWGLYIMAGISFSIVLFICWYSIFTEVKGSRFH
jgi:hypothetical protein